jgi:hypothetical protein
MSIGTIWGTTQDECTRAFPRDTLSLETGAVYYRGVTVHAPAGVVYRWLCQMRAAPYSYDWIDNFGRRSPQQLIAGLDDLALGQKLMGAFEVVDFARDHHLTGRASLGTFGGITATYLIVPSPAGGCRLLVKLVVAYPRGLLGRVLRWVLPWGDLVMMRRQLLNFKRLAEDTARESNDAVSEDVNRASPNR